MAIVVFVGGLGDAYNEQEVHPTVEDCPVLLLVAAGLAGSAGGGSREQVEGWLLQEVQPERQGTTSTAALQLLQLPGNQSAVVWTWRCAIAPLSTRCWWWRHLLVAPRVHLLTPCTAAHPSLPLLYRTLSTSSLPFCRLWALPATTEQTAAAPVEGAPGITGVTSINGQQQQQPVGQQPTPAAACSW